MPPSSRRSSACWSTTWWVSARSSRCCTTTSVTDIMVNGPYQVYVERKGKVELTDVVFRDDPHVLHVATRIVTEVGRRVDESAPSGRCALAGWLPCQHHHPAAGADGRRR